LFTFRFHGVDSTAQTDGLPTRARPESTRQNTTNRYGISIREKVASRRRIETEPDPSLTRFVAVVGWLWNGRQNFFGRSIRQRRRWPGWYARRLGNLPPPRAPAEGLIGIHDRRQLLALGVNQDHSRVQQVTLSEKHVDVFGIGIQIKVGGDT